MTTPTTAQVRDKAIAGAILMDPSRRELAQQVLGPVDHSEYDEGGEDFDRWLAQLDVEAARTGRALRAALRLRVPEVVDPLGTMGTTYRGGYRTGYHDALADLREAIEAELA